MNRIVFSLSLSLSLYFFLFYSFLLSFIVFFFFFFGRVGTHRELDDGSERPGPAETGVCEGGSSARSKTASEPFSLVQ